MKKIIGILIVIAVVIGGFFLFLKDMPRIEQNDYKNIPYIVDGETVTLKNGVSEVSVPGSATVITTRYFGNEASGDLNGDGIPDTAFLLTQNGGGTGTFYFVVVALKTVTGYGGTNSVFLGDRIAPQTTEIKNGEIIVNYADRKDGEPMTTTPSVGVSKRLKVANNGSLMEVFANDDLVHVTTPLPNSTIKSPITITGEARGNWYFEASFPVELVDANGKQLAIKPAQAQGEWMTTEFVPFSVTLTFTKPTTPTGTLILHKDNASGLPEHDDQISIPVRF